MKQKNLILMVVAVGCGLLAAFLTSQMTAKPETAPQQVEVLVVAKELAPGTKFSVDTIKDHFKKKLYNPDAIPEKAVFTEDQLDGKTLNKTLRVDDFVRETDLGNYTPLLPPEGKHIASVRLPVDRMCPFLQPNNRVDLIGTHQNHENKVKTKVLIPNLLVMGVDTKVTPPNGGTAGDLGVQMASVAVSQDEALAIRACEHSQVKLSFVLRSETGKGNTETKEEWSLADVINWINSDSAESKTGSDSPPDTTRSEPVTEKTTKVTVPTSDLPAGTQLTADVVGTKFKEVSIIGDAPSNMVANIKEHIGRFLQKDVAAEQFVPKSYVGDQAPKAPESGKPRATTGDEASPKSGSPELPKAPETKKLPTFDRTFTTPAGTKVYRYEVHDNGSMKLLGEVIGDGSVVPATDPKDEKNSGANKPVT